jgi:U3 small nucleolar ribonucleoprotein component
MSKRSSHVFTLRLRNPETYRMLKLAAKQRRVSMNDIAQEALEEYLNAEASTLEEQLSEALDIVRQYTSQDQDRDIAAFAHAEVSEKDPLRSTGVTPDDDPFGVRDAFVRSVE